MTDTCDEGRRQQPRKQAAGTADPLGMTNLVLLHQQRRLVTQLSPAGTGSPGWQQQRQHCAPAREIEETEKNRTNSAAPKHTEKPSLEIKMLEEQPETPQDARSRTGYQQAGGDVLAGTGKGLKSHHKQNWTSAMGSGYGTVLLGYRLPQRGDETPPPSAGCLMTDLVELQQGSALAGG